MRHHRVYLPSILSVILLASCAPRYGANWRHISEGGLSVMMPGQPVRSKDGDTVLFVLRSGAGIYMASHTLTITPNPEQREQALDANRNAFINGVGGTLIAEHASSLAGYPGRELTVAVAQYGQEIKARTYIAQSIIYHVSVSYPQGKPLPPDAEKFLASLELPAR